MPNENVILFKYIYRIVCNKCNFFFYICMRVRMCVLFSLSRVDRKETV